MKRTNRGVSESVQVTSSEERKGKYRCVEEPRIISVPSGRIHSKWTIYDFATRGDASRYIDVGKRSSEQLTSCRLRST